MLMNNLIEFVTFCTFWPKNVRGLQKDRFVIRFQHPNYTGNIDGLFDKQCVNFGTQEDGYIDYVKGANIAAL